MSFFWSNKMGFAGHFRENKQCAMFNLSAQNYDLKQVATGLCSTRGKRHGYSQYYKEG